MTGLRDSIFSRLGGRFYYGWVVLAVAGLGIFASGPGQSHSFSVFVGPIARDLGLSTSAVASAYSIATLVAALGLPAMGRLVDRRGARRVGLVVVVLLGVACIAFGAVTSFAALALGFAALRFLAQGSLMMNCSNLVSQWFSARRGFALGLMALGFAASMAIHPPLGQALIEHLGWRRAWLVLGLLTWALMIPPYLLLVHDRPEDRGLLPDGAAPDPDPAAAGPGARLTGLTLRQALATSAFHIVALGMGVISMMVTALHFYQVSIFEAQGLGAQLASRVFPISAVIMVIAMPLVGALLDRCRTRYVFAAALVVVSGALTAASLVHDLVTALVFAVVFGVTNAASMTLFGYMWPRYFGRRFLGSILGAGQMIGVVGASLGPLPLGFGFDISGDYAGTLRILALFPLLCAALAMFLRTPPVPAGEDAGGAIGWPEAAGERDGEAQRENGEPT